MNEKRAATLLGVASVLTLATIGFLGWRLYALSQGPSQEELAQQARASRQVTASTAQEGIDALLAMTLPDLQGKPQPFAQWQGKVRVINYWASWCPPCVEEMPLFSHLHEKYAAAGVQFVGVGMDETDKMLTFVARSPVSYPLLAGGPNPSGVPGLTVRGLPYTVVVDRDGKVLLSIYGGVKENDLVPLLDRLTATPQKG